MKIYNSIKNLPDGFKKPIVKKKECYNNTILFCMLNEKKFNEQNMKIAYGYFNQPTLAGNLWFRHCFVINSNDEVIDIPCMEEENILENRYVVFKTFNSISELMDIPEYTKDTSLNYQLLSDEKELLLQCIDDSMREMTKETRYSQDIVILNI